MAKKKKIMNKDKKNDPPDSINDISVVYYYVKWITMRWN